MKTLQIDNKHYQECDVVMLENSNPSNIVLHTINNRLLLDDDKTLVERILPKFGRNEELYILSNEIPKENDLCINANNRIVRALKDDRDFEPLKKIIATTDEYLGCSNTSISHLFAQIPQSFIGHYIREYNKGNLISKVLVEVEEKEYLGEVFNGRGKPTKMYSDINNIKLNQNNEISILTEQKQVFSRKEVVRLLNDLNNTLNIVNTPEFEGEITFEDWIQQNLK